VAVAVAEVLGLANRAASRAAKSMICTEADIPELLTLLPDPELE
jgi:hypothetical protein